MELPASLPAPAQQVVQGVVEESVGEAMQDEGVQDEPVAEIDEAVEAKASTDTPIDITESEIITECAEPGIDDVAAVESAASEPGNPIGSLVQKMRHWLRRAA
jgi:hypothetical protein